MGNTSGQLQAITPHLKALNSPLDIYISYIEFKMFVASLTMPGFYYHVRPRIDTIKLIGNIYLNSTTTPSPFKINRGIIQGDTLSPYLFMIFFKPLLHWLSWDSRSYKFITSNCQITTIAYVDDLAILTNDIQHIQPQLNKLQHFNDWASMDLGISKCVIIGYPNKSKPPPLSLLKHFSLLNTSQTKLCTPHPIPKRSIHIPRY